MSQSTESHLAELAKFSAEYKESLPRDSIGRVMNKCFGRMDDGSMCESYGIDVSKNKMGLFLCPEHQLKQLLQLMPTIMSQSTESHLAEDLARFRAEYKASLPRDSIGRVMNKCFGRMEDGSMCESYGIDVSKNKMGLFLCPEHQ